ncbi:TetR/AcrR family transcriptional regulator C-terminal domain-containing protein [Nocardia amamiensis]|uniref:TetR/AcrR family transcriptional regulator C-terminal domain-containing protein n=1 Tax=Nocardia amamiensis TaxID=404578 RepID=A0ABS0CZM7_9NOCA|nr:TetR/AcrR family transcriptional regulator C-terminal domain-containing protein [Nocardia amamiensis]MBF6302050.1 TetR/AcrR family transcriptional regulator C-terminal domain-containing protein [Nocardia amamiensis]
MADEPPRVARLLWSGDQRSGRGRRPALSLDRIVGAAIAIADAEGIGALSMQRVANQLDAATMSLYRHVASKDELVALMLDTTMAGPPELPRGDWRAALEHWARRTRDLYLRHPWVLAIGASNRWMGPNEAAWGEAAMAALLDAGLAPHGIADIVLSINAFVGGVARLEIDPTRGREAAGHVGPVLDPAMIHQYGQPERYPALLAMLTAGPAGDRDIRAVAEGVFEFGLAKLLDGIAIHLTA